MKVVDTTVAQQLLIDFCEAYNRRDLATLLSMFCRDAEIWGTAEDEYRQGVKAIEAQFLRDWAQSQAGEINIDKLGPGDQNTDAWASAICHTRLTIDRQQHVFYHLRGSIGVRREQGRMKIAFMHCSFPDYRNPEANSFPVAQSIDKA